MGIKTLISADDLKPYFEVSKLIETKHGVSDTVYIVDDKYVLKVFEEADEKTIQNEVELLKLCESLAVAKLQKELFYIKNKPSLLYKKCDGESLRKSDLGTIEQIGKFLKQFHKLTKNRSNTNIKLFEKNRLKKLIDQTDHQEFINIFNSLDIELKDDGIIHGDLFIDNAIFKNGRLSCVIDFSEACSGDFIFDLAVTALSWCRDDNDIEVLLRSYGTDIEIKSFKRYINYGVLYYSVTRYLDNRDYKELLGKIYYD